MSDVVRVRRRPPVRCSFFRLLAPREGCGKNASHMRLVASTPVPQFYCFEHSERGDELITDDALFRLVSIALEVGMCGVHELPGVSHAEAVWRLELAVAAAGGLVDTVGCQSTLARGEVLPPVGRQRGGRGREQ